MSCHIRLMRKEDIAQVTEIDREAFPTMWPPANYLNELQNRLAHYIIACDEEKPTALRVGTCKQSRLRSDPWRLPAKTWRARRSSSIPLLSLRTASCSVFNRHMREHSLGASEGDPTKACTQVPSLVARATSRIGFQACRVCLR